jgi:DNA-binding transcriptional LysR family regulator
MSEPDLNLLNALDVLLAECGVAGAARRLGLSASAMSRTLGRLRTVTGDPLLVRAGRVMVATPRALAMREQVRKLVDDSRAVLRPAVAPDFATLERTFSIRANEGFVETFGARLVAEVTQAAPRVRLRFAPKPDKDVRPLREGLVDLEIGVVGETAPEFRIQALIRDRMVGVVRADHALASGEITAERYAAAGHVIVSRRGRSEGPVDQSLAERGLSRRVVVIVPSFPAAVAIARSSDLVALVPELHTAIVAPDLLVFPLPVTTAPLTISQIWHPRLDADPTHRWLRGLVLAACQAHQRIRTTK